MAGLRRCLLAAGLAAFAFGNASAACAADSEQWGLQELMSALASRTGAQARFIERKHIKILDAPLELTGRLVYIAPEKFEKRTLTPKPELVRVDGQSLTIENAAWRKPRTFRLDEHPVLWGFVESFRGTLSGNLESLRRFYAVQLNGVAEDWELMLVPRVQSMRAVVSLIRIRGSRDRLRLVEVTEAQGDRSSMQIFEDDR